MSTVPEDVKDVKVGSLIALFVEEGEDWKDVEIPADTSAPPSDSPSPSSDSPSPPSQSGETRSLEPSVSKGSHSGKIRLQSPTARNLLTHFGIDVSNLTASGPKDTLLKEDVLNYIKENNLTPKSESPPSKSESPLSGSGSRPGGSGSRPGGSEGRPRTKYVDLELTNMRKIIAKRLTLSKTTIPHSYMTVECNMDEVSRARQELKSQGVKVSVNDFIIRAAAVSLCKCPQVNVRWNESQGTIESVRGVDISIAVATPNGLITPIVKDADTLSVEGIAERVRELSVKARDGKLQPHEFQGGSFSISNLGMFGIKEFSAVINPPQAAILAVGRGIPTFNPSGQVNEVMKATLSFDSRAIDEEVAAEFIQTFSTLLSQLRLGSPETGKRLSALLIS